MDGGEVVKQCECTNATELSVQGEMAKMVNSTLCIFHCTHTKNSCNQNIFHHQFMPPDVGQPIPAVPSLFVHAYEFLVTDSLLLCILLFLNIYSRQLTHWRAATPPLCSGFENVYFQYQTLSSISCSHFHILAGVNFTWKPWDFIRQHARRGWWGWGKDHVSGSTARTPVAARRTPSGLKELPITPQLIPSVAPVHTYHEPQTRQTWGSVPFLPFLSHFLPRGFQNMFPKHVPSINHQFWEASQKKMFSFHNFITYYFLQIWSSPCSFQRSLLGGCKKIKCRVCPCQVTERVKNRQLLLPAWEKEGRAFLFFLISCLVQISFNCCLPFPKTLMHSLLV